MNGALEALAKLRESVESGRSKTELLNPGGEFTGTLGERDGTHLLDMTDSQGNTCQFRVIDGEVQFVTAQDVDGVQLTLQEIGRERFHALVHRFTEGARQLLAERDTQA